jgi:hypothetical protein
MRLWWLNVEERIHITVRFDSQGHEEVAAVFNRLHPKRLPITQTSVRRLMTKIREKEEHREPPERCTDESTSLNVLVQMDVSLPEHFAACLLRFVFQPPQHYRILESQKWHPYKLNLLR